MLLTRDQTCMQCPGQFVNQCVTPEEIVSIFKVERLQAFVGVARFERRFSGYVSCNKRDCHLLRGKLDRLKFCDDLIKHRMIVVLPCINDGKLATVRGNARTPGLTLYPYRKERTLIDASQL